MPLQLFDVEAVYAEDRDLKRSDVEMLREWMEKQTHLPKISEQQLILFLHSCYYSPEKAKKVIDVFFTVRTLCPELYNLPTMEVLKEAMTVSTLCILPKRTPEGYAVLMAALLNPYPEHFVHINQINFLDKITMLHLLTHKPIKGALMVLDMKGLSFGHVTRFNLAASKKQAYLAQEGAPLRVVGVHYLNVGPLVHKLVALMKPLLKKEIIELLHFHTESMETLYEYVPKEILPEDYGGEAPPYATLHEGVCKDVLENVEFYGWLQAQKVDESKRSGKPKNANEIFGLEGSFKKLDLD